MPLTRTPLGANSVAMERTRFLRPARAAEVATMCGSGCEASSELTQTMAGCAVRSSCGKKARVGCSTEKNFRDRKSTRLNSSHLVISYAVFCLKKKTYEIYVVSLH